MSGLDGNLERGNGDSGREDLHREQDTPDSEDSDDQQADLCLDVLEDAAVACPAIVTTTFVVACVNDENDEWCELDARPECLEAKAAPKVSAAPEVRMPIDSLDRVRQDVLGSEWRAMLHSGFASDADVFSVADGERAANAVGEELAAHLAVMAGNDMENWEFTLELGHLGDIDGQVSMGATHVNIELRPHEQSLARLLDEHKGTLEEFASAEVGIEVIVRIS